MIDCNSWYQKASKIYNNKYTYEQSDIKYKYDDTITIICLEHGPFNRRLKQHLYFNKGCPTCDKLIKLKNKQIELIEKSVLKHNNKYDYSYTNFNTSKKEVDIVCPDHGIFKQKLYLHSIGHGCQKCAQNKTIAGVLSDSNNILLKLRMMYNYEFKNIDNYIGQHMIISFICPEHGDMKNTINRLLSGHGCKKCGMELIKKSKLLTRHECFNRANNVHNNKYNYSITKWRTIKDKVDIICSTHGIFNQSWRDHMRGIGCKKCFVSSGEQAILKYFNNLNFIKYETEYAFDNCIDKGKLRFDFYLPDYNICIEYDGIQHFECVEYFGGQSSLLNTQRRDIIKNKYCEDNNIKLLRISYKDKNKINDILEMYLKDIV